MFALKDPRVTRFVIQFITFATDFAGVLLSAHNDMAARVAMVFGQ